MNFKKLKEKRAQLQEEMNGILVKADKEERALSDEETTRFDEIEKEIKGIDATLAAEERARNLINDDEDDQDDNKGNEDSDKAEERAFENYIRGVVEERAAVNMTMTDNGAVVPASIAKKIIEKVVDMCPIFNDAERYNVGGTLTIPYYDDENGDIEMAYADEFTEGDSTSGNFKNISLKGYLGRAITDVSKSLINNSSFDITNFVINRMAIAISKFIEGELLHGTTNKIEGLKGIKQIITSGSATSITSDELIELQESVPDAYQADAYWIMNKKTRTHIRKMKDGQGNYLLNKDASARWGYTLLGKDVYTSANMKEMAAGNRAVIYGDMKGLAVKISEDISTEVLRETKARQHLIEVLGFVELDAKVQNAEMISALDMKTV